MIKNYIKIIKSILRYRISKKGSPLFIGWELTDRCNYSCQYCRTQDMSFSRKNELKTEKVLHIIRELASLGCVAIAFSGGECLLRDDLDDIITCAHNAGIITKITTNGKLLPEKIQKMQHLDYITISVDGTPQRHNFLRGRDAFADVEKAIDCACQNKKKIILNMVLTKPSIEDIPFIIEFAKTKGVSVSFQPLEARFLKFENIQELVPSKDEMQNAISMIKQIKSKKTCSIRNPVFVLDELQQWPDFSCNQCYAGKLHYRIKADGKLTACSYQDDKNKIDLTQHKNIKEAIKNLRIAPLQKGCSAVYTRELNAILSFNIKAIVSRIIS